VTVNLALFVKVQNASEYLGYALQQPCRLLCATQCLE
jgi:hypothetical protein